MTKPLALLCYEKLMPGVQLKTRLEQLGYRVQTLSDVRELPESAETAGPMLVIVDLFSRQNPVPASIGRLRQNPVTNHLPVIAFASDRDEKQQKAALEAGATLVAGETAMLMHLEPLLDQALLV
jgi:CheY-like chemotaxis protein